MIEKWMILIRILMESANVDGKENHSGKDQGSIEDVNNSVWCIEQNLLEN